MKPIRAFTLVELLVVVAIIIALLSLLLPSASKALYHAQSIHCASNKRQIMVAMLNYAGDYTARFPNWTGDGNQYWMQDQPGNIFTVTRDEYALPLEMWSCTVGDTPQLPYKWGGYGPAYKWKMSGAAWWVMRGSVGQDSYENPARHIISDKLSKAAPGSVVVSDKIGGSSEPTSSYHAFAGKVIEGSVVRVDASSEMIPVADIQIRNPNEGWGHWWY